MLTMNYDYNTQRKRMALPEYGRNVQKMVDHIKTIEDRAERNRAAKTIISIILISAMSGILNISYGTTWH
jgi:hypothetical protein